MKGMETLLNPEEHMTDDDKGLHAEQFATDLALLQHRQANAIDPNAVSAYWCEACGMEIPEARREALPGVKLCVDCAREQELKEKQWK